MNSKEENVTRTNDEATESKLAAIQLGLLEDDQLNSLLETRNCKIVKEPLIIRGTVIRAKIIDQYLIREASVTQIVNLGCGFDTRALKHPEKTFFEVDFASVLSEKENLFGKPVNVNYCPCDLESDNLCKLLVHAGIDVNKPTLIMAECCFMYLEINTVRNLQRELAEMFKSCSIITFDAIKGKDAFGNRMTDNLPYKMPFFSHCSSKVDYVNIFDKFKCVDSFNMLEAESRLSDFKQTLDSKCMLDELEEWRIISGHYLFCRFLR